jgi:hypothetical protein
MTGKGGCKEAKYNEMNVLVLYILGKESVSVEGLDGDD